MKIKHRVIGFLTAAVTVMSQTVLTSNAEIIPAYTKIHTVSAAAGEAEAPQLLYEDIPVAGFTVSDLSPETDTPLDYTDWWYSEWEDCRYIFLPVTADRSSLTVTYSADDTIFLNGSPVSSGEKTSLLSEADEFDITVGGKDCGKLKVMQSDIGCIYLSTSSGGLDALDKNRNHIETGTVLMLNADGGTEYSGAIEKLTSHGNSSWDYSKKKPYNLKLPQKENLYGMGKAKKWVLLSNYLDHSMLRNKLTEEMCKAAGIEFTLDSVFVDMYADGSYRGTYQLYEKVQIQKKRVNIRDLEEDTEKLNDLDLEKYPQKVVGAASAKEYMENSYKYYDIPNEPDDITGGYLLQFQQANRYGGKAESGFITSRGQAVAVDGPEYASKAQVEYIRSFVQDMEDAIYSETGYNSKGKHYSDYLDVDSFAKAYLVEEISQNIDAANSSFFFWKDSDLTGDGKIHFGPPWDFDFAYSNFISSTTNSEGQTGFSYRPDSLYAAYTAINGYKGSGRPTLGISWLGQINKHEAFARRVAEIYFDNFEPFLYDLTEGEHPYILRLAEDIQSSAEMSNARWHTYGGREYQIFGNSSGENFTASVNILWEYVGKRRDWLSAHWQPDAFVYGDVNGDGKFNISDAVTFQQWLLSVPDTKLVRWQAADMYGDHKLDSFDLCLMRQELLSK